MTKIKTLMAVAMMALVTLSTGCSGTKQIGRIGDLELYRVTIRGLDVPNISTLATRNVQDNSVNFVDSAHGAGLGPALVSAAGGVGAAAVNGVSLRPSTTRVNNNSGSASQTGDVSSGSTSNGGNSSATGGAGGSGQGYGSAGATSSSNSQSGSYSQSDSWSGVIGSGNAVQSVCVHGAGCGVCKR